MSNSFVLHYKLQDKFKTIHSINCKYLSTQSCYYYFTHGIVTQGMTAFFCQ